MNSEFKTQDKYKSKFNKLFLELHANESILFKAMKGMDLTLSELLLLPALDIGDYLLQIRRKKKTTKKSKKEPLPEM